MLRNGTNVALSRCMAIASVALLIPLMTLNAAEPEIEKSETVAKQLLAEAMHSELYGDTDRRDELLMQAQKVAPDYAPVRWQQGYLKIDGKWQLASEAGQCISENPLFTKYLKLRKKFGQSTDDQFKIAQWCRKNGLREQERAHLNKILEDEPNNGVAHRRLGNVLVNDRWVTREQMQADLEQVVENRENLVKWRGQMNRIARQLTSGDPAENKVAQLELASITDTSAILPMEQIVSGINEESALLVTRQVGKMSGRDAAISLARQAVFSPFPKVRELAAVNLKSYEQLSYVPAMLSELRTPIIGTRSVSQTRDGRLVYRHVFYSETQDEKQVVVRETEYRRVARPGGNSRTAAAQAIRQLNQNMSANAMESRMRNQSLQQMNRAITDVLTVATGEQNGNDPKKWWDWWSQNNEIYITKNIAIAERSQSVAVIDPVPQSGRRGFSGGGQVSPSCECLVEGTQIMTSSGLRSVEKIQVGDFVLSKDSKTGELAFKPVLRTTVRAPSEIVSIVAGQENIRSSQGHPFWVGGKGWVLAKELKSGMNLHSAKGPILISAVSKSSKETTYNLVVEDFNTYFVGKSQILSHDFTLRQATDAELPGMVKE